MPGAEVVIADDCGANEADVSLGVAGVLILQGEFGEVAIKFRATAVERFDGMIGAELFDEAGFSHLAVVVASKKEGDFRRRRRRGSGRGAASRAARNFFHCAALRVNSRRSARASLARARGAFEDEVLSERLRRRRRREAWTWPCE